jgi:hypothetical protein
VPSAVFVPSPRLPTQILARCSQSTIVHSYGVLAYSSSPSLPSGDNWVAGLYKSIEMNTSKPALVNQDPAARIAELLDGLAMREGKQPTRVTGVEVSRTSYPTTGTPVVYEPMILFIAQGRKIGYVGGEVLTYDKDHYLALSVPIPFQCRVEATSEDPVLALVIAVDPAMLSEILINLDEPTTSEIAVPRGIYSSAITGEIRSAVVRLLECLRSEVDSRILGPQVVREIVYRVLQREQGARFARWPHEMISSCALQEFYRSSIPILLGRSARRIWPSKRE